LVLIVAVPALFGCHTTRVEDDEELS
jgi:hypothetical protein